MMAVRKIRPKKAVKSKTTRTPSRAKSGKTPSKTSSKTGRGAKTGFAVARKENQKAKARAEQRNQPFRFFIKQGESARLTILDKEPYFFYEHQWEQPKGQWGNFETCIKESGVCPLCQSLGREGRYTMMLTVIDHRKYEDRKGKVHRNSRKLLPVPPTMIPKFERVFNRKKSFRGAVVKMYRDSDKGARIGDDLEFIKFAKESDIAKYGDQAKVFEYEKHFGEKSEKELRKMYGGNAPMGSEDTEEDDEEELESRWDDEDDED